MLSLLVVAVDAFDQVDAGGEHRWFITVVSLVAGTGWPPSSRHLVPRSTSHPGYALRPGIYLLFVPFRVYRHPVKAAYASVSPVDVLSRDRYAFSARCPVPDCFHCSVPRGEGLRRLCALESGRTRGILMTMYCGSSLFVVFSLLSFSLVAVRYYHSGHGG